MRLKLTLQLQEGREPMQPRESLLEDCIQTLQKLSLMCTDHSYRTHSRMVGKWQERVSLTFTLSVDPSSLPIGWYQSYSGRIFLSESLKIL